MNPSITQIITMPEDQTLEFKRNLSSPKNILKTMVAFANSAGGRLQVGVEDGTREILGIVNPLDEEERLCNLIADSIEPRLVPNVELIAWQDKSLLSVEVYPSGSRPHWLKSEGQWMGSMFDWVPLTEKPTGHLLKSSNAPRKAPHLMKCPCLS